MSGGGQGGHHGLPHGYDHGHFPEEEMLNEMGDRSYKLSPHEKDSLNEIEKVLKSGEHIDHHELHEYQHFLEHFTHHMKHILQEEHQSHIHNMQLEKDLRKAAQLLQEISSIMERHH